ncbi:MAG TPA: oxygenase MpaB family protein [Ohtaekwangia sp.]|nr:oxygenase MpaB family protein [Ohtaekwangia sp.]
MWFVSKHSIVREIWGKADTILFIFAGAAAEFALNKAVDWLFFTGKLPADPLGRLFSTVNYARKIVFSETEKAHEVIDRMADIHKEVENKRGSTIPAWAYRDVLYMLIDYSIRSYELLERRLSTTEKEEVYHVFRRVGVRMKIETIPFTFNEWLEDRKRHSEHDLEKSQYTEILFKQYRKRLGFVRYYILRLAQGEIVPAHVKGLLHLKGSFIMKMIIRVYKYTVYLRIDWMLKKSILPTEYFDEIKRLDIYK